MRYTGCDAVMSSEALLENPALFEPSTVIQAEKTLFSSESSREREEDVQLIAATQMALAWEYIGLAKQFPPAQGNAVVGWSLLSLSL